MTRLISCGLKGKERLSKNPNVHLGGYGVGGRDLKVFGGEVKIVGKRIRGLDVWKRVTCLR